MTGGKIIRPAPAEIEFKNMRFLITEQPQDATIQNYIKILKEHHVTHLVYATDPTYGTDDLSKVGVSVTELSFQDGSAPSSEIVDKWLVLLNKVFCGDGGAANNANGNAANSAAVAANSGAGGGCVGVHCVTGLGRAPVLVAVALIELGMKYEDAVEMIRKKRRGAINSRQLEFLAKYKRKKVFTKGKGKCHIQ